MALPRDRVAAGQLVKMNGLEQPEPREACRYAKLRSVYSFAAKAKLLAPLTSADSFRFAKTAWRRYGGRGGET